MKAYLQKLLDLIRTILAVIELADGGFRITKAHNEDLGTDMYRFWWKTEMLPQHGDITHLGPERWSSMLNGSSLRLDLLGPDLGGYYRHKQLMDYCSQDVEFAQALFEQKDADAIRLAIHRVDKQLESAKDLVQEIRSKLK